MMEYKGSIGVSEVDEETGLIFGEVAGLRDVITYQGRTVAEARRSFRGSIDLYLQTCADEGLEPDRPYSGKMLIRTKPSVHRVLATHAKARGESLNELANRILTRVARHLSQSTDRPKAENPQPKLAKRKVVTKGRARASRQKRATA